MIPASASCYTRFILPLTRKKTVTGHPGADPARSATELEPSGAEGHIDFAALFGELRRRGHRGWFSLGFGDDADKVRIKEWFSKLI